MKEAKKEPFTIDTKRKLRGIGGGCRHVYIPPAIAHHKNFPIRPDDEITLEIHDDHIVVRKSQ